MTSSEHRRPSRGFETRWPDASNPGPPRSCSSFPSITGSIAMWASTGCRSWVSKSRSPDWNSYGEYLDSIENLAPAINVSGLVGHAAARFYVMGERAIDEQPTNFEIEQIAALIGKSVKDGAMGFSTSRLRAHVLPDGRCIPGTFATEQELVAISKAVGKYGGMLQSVIESGSGKLDEEMRLMKKQLTAAGTRLLFSAPWEPGKDGASAYQEAIDDMRSSGLDITGTTQPRAAGFLSGLKTDILFGMRLKGPAWRELRRMDFDDRLAAIRNSEFHHRLIEEARRTRPAESIGQTMSSSTFSIPTLVP